MSDGFEILGYFTGFWLFIFNKGFRVAWIEELKEGSYIEKVLQIVGAIFSTICGFIVPLILVYFLFFN